MNKKEWLDCLYYKVGKQQYDFQVCNLRKENEEVKASKWYKYSEVCFELNPWESEEISQVNNRTILPNEIVLDIEEPSKLEPTLKKLIRITPEDTFKVYSTGSRGYHIHIFFPREITKEEKAGFIQIFGADITKAGNKVMIALENCPHWKTGKIKEEFPWKKLIL